MYYKKKCGCNHRRGACPASCRCGCCRPKSCCAAPKPVAREYMNNTAESGAFEDYLIDAGLESTVIDSHQQFVNDIQKTTSGASVETVLAGDVDDNPWVGIRRPNYDVKVDSSARTVPSAEQSRMPTARRYSGSGHF